jgi:FkbM family methyltransferase
MLNHGAALALHKLRIYGALDTIRDFAEWSVGNMRSSFSQFGEDLFLSEYFGDRTGVYIDIGGNHPFRLSNTYLLYRKGWCGLIAEPIQDFYAKHKRYRPRDIQVNAAAGEGSGQLTFYELWPSVLSTCDAVEVQRTLAGGRASLLRQYTVPLVTVDKIYRDHLFPRPVSLLSVDTEGHDLSVLKGIDWSILRPEIVICEANNPAAEQSVVEFLRNLNYRSVKTCGVNRIFAAT